MRKKNSQVEGLVRKIETIIGFQLAQETLQARWMEEAYIGLAERALAGKSTRLESLRYLIGVAGVPGCGKSTLSKAVCDRINELTGGDIAINVPMDGFHLYRRELDAMPDPQAAHARRGAPWTFNADAYVQFLSKAKTERSETLTAPSFDHGVGDPVENSIAIRPTHKIVVSEGNYVLLGE